MNGNASALLGIAVGLAIVVAAQWDGAARQRAAPVISTALSKPAMPALSDEELAQNFRAVMKRASYPINGWTSDQSAYEERIDGLRSVLESRGKDRWNQILAKAAPVDFRKFTDSELLELLYGRPWAKSSDGPDQRYEIPLMREILSRGGDWDRLSAEWPWLGLDGLSNERLKGLWESAQKTGEFEGNPERERVLTEMIRRGGPEWEAFLEALLATAATQPSSDAFGKPGADLEVLTALRRIQKRRDPVAIRVTPPLKLEVQFPKLPELEVALINQDVEGQSVGYTVGGNYRSGRQTRWRIEATDQTGKAVPVIESLGFGMGGGIFNVGSLGPKDQWQTTLNVGSYLPALLPGHYTLRVMYHDEMTIAGLKGVTGLIVSRSPVIELTVKPLVVVQNPDVMADIRRWALSIHDEPTKIVAGTYGEWVYDFVAPDSPRGKVLSRGLDAVPALLDVLDDAQLKPRQRAEVLSLLFSVTGQNDPRDEAGVVGGYQARMGPWALQANGHWMGLGMGGSVDVPGGIIDEEKQKAFAKRWAPWKKYVVVEMRI